MNGIAQAAEPGNGSAHGLTAQQTLEVKTMVEETVERSESRVLLALDDIRSEMKELRSEVSSVNRRVDTLVDGLAEVKTSVADLKVGMKDLKVRLYVSVLVLLVITLAFPGAAQDLLIPLLSRSSP